MMNFPHSSPDTMQKQDAAAAAADANGGVTSDTKYSKDEVNYRPAGSSNTRCERCSNFRFSAGDRGAGSCRVVAGRIDSTYVCDKFTSGGSGLVDLVTRQPTR